MHKGIIGLALLATALAGCGGSGEDVGKVSLRGLNTLKGSSIELITTAGDLSSDLAFGGQTSFTQQPVPLLTDVFARRVSSIDLLASLSVTPTANHQYTYVVGGREGSVVNPPTIWSLLDDLSSPSAGQARIRFFGISPANTSIDVYVTSTTATLPSSTPRFAALAYGQLTAGLSLAPGAWRVRVTPAGDNATVLADLNPLNTTPGEVRTIVISDRNTGTGAYFHVLADVN